MTSLARRTVAVVVVLMQPEGILLVQRKDGEVARPYWELPSASLNEAEPLHDAALRALLSFITVDLGPDALDQVGIYDDPEVVGDLVVVFSARMQPIKLFSLKDIDVTWVTAAVITGPKKLEKPALAPGLEDIVRIFLNKRFN